MSSLTDRVLKLTVISVFNLNLAQVVPVKERVHKQMEGATSGKFDLHSTLSNHRAVTTEGNSTLLVAAKAILKSLSKWVLHWKCNLHLESCCSHVRPESASILWMIIDQSWCACRTLLFLPYSLRQVDPEMGTIALLGWHPDVVYQSTRMLISRSTWAVAPAQRNLGSAPAFCQFE